MKLKFFITTLFFFSAACGAAQAQNIKGTIRDAESNEPLIGASVYWAGTTIGSSTDAEGAYALHRVRGYDQLVASYVGYNNDTIRVESGVEQVDFRLTTEGVQIESVVVESNLGGNYVKREGILKGEMISFAGLCKMACCNLAESFENSASVTVGYSDAISGARQIKMLGLAGTYTQILDENRPIMRGLSAPYGLSYTPGMWLNSIQVSKGISSVTAGHEAITGQINLEHRKPTDDERLFINLYVDDELRPEMNLTSALPVTKDGKLSTIFLVHGSMDTHVFGDMDFNKDGFMDLPKTRLGTVANRWLYTADNGAQLRWGFKYLAENRLSGTDHYKASMREEMERDLNPDLYGSQIKNRELNAYVKFGIPVGPSVYDEEEQDELRSNFALVADYDRFHENAYFGLNNYAGLDNIVSLNAMYNHYFAYRHSLIVGVQSHFDFIDETLLNPTPWLNTLGALGDNRTMDLGRSENEVGAYAEYTYTIKEKFSLVAGVRGDYNTYYNKFYFTPRGHIKWNITPTTILRGSAGLGYRSTSVITDNIGILATGRQIVFGNPSLGPQLHGDFKSLNRMEKALTVGGSLMQVFTLVEREDATLSFDYFRTQFYNQVVADQEYSADQIYLYDTNKRSFTDTFQIDFSWTPIERFDIFATYRYTNSRMTINRPDGTTALVERPLISRYKALLNLQYATRYRRWTFDVTAQLNGPSRLPTQTGNLADAGTSPVYPMFFAQVTHKVGKFDIYLGCENILDYRQKNPILNADDPWSAGFNSSVIWGPLMGRKFYVGVRINFY